MRDPNLESDGSDHRTDLVAVPRARGEYGLDAPYVPLMLVSLGLVGLGLAVLLRHTAGWSMGFLLQGLFTLASGASYLVTTRWGKFAVWNELLDQLDLQGHERVLDLGCGRGAVLLLAAHRLPRGRAVGVDLWSTVDQSGNHPQATWRNAKLEGVADRIDLHTRDIRELRFADGSFDVVVSSVTLHNISGPGGRVRAVEEAARVVKRGGRVLIADIRSTRAYASELKALGFENVTVRSLGWRFWYGGPWMATRLVSGTRPF